MLNSSVNFYFLLTESHYSVANLAKNRNIRSVVSVRSPAGLYHYLINSIGNKDYLARQRNAGWLVGLENN